MADKPILFSAPMVRALLAGTKTQTRRLLALRGHKSFSEFGPSDTVGYDWHFRDAEMRWHDLRHDELLARLRIVIGDRLWVRESWRPDPNGLESGGSLDVFYTADKTRLHLAPAPGWLMPKAALQHAVPGIHMPRWASRLTLTVSDVRVQRLQEISDEDALAEGIDLERPAPIAGTDIDIDGQWWPGAYRRRYRDLWNSINGAGSWDANPWVAAYTFIVAHLNIDQPPKE